MQRDPEGTATVFRITELTEDHPNGGRTGLLDVQEDDSIQYLDDENDWRPSQVFKW